jgi:CobQ-like glutamine amidotransferase family enzyme
MKFRIGYLYKNQLNLYGDNGNIEILVQRAKRRDIPVEVTEIGLEAKIDSNVISNLNMLFMGGGPDSEQKLMYKDLILDKGKYIKEYVDREGVGLFICGSYQLFGHYYLASDGTKLEGLNIFDLHTQHFGPSKPRCIGNTSAILSDRLLNEPFFKNNNNTGESIVGFENHGGRTYLHDTGQSLARVSKGHGNNSEDGTEGIYYNNSIGTYFHGPFLARNPHIADFLIAKALFIDKLQPLDDELINRAHTASKELTP